MSSAYEQIGFAIAPIDPTPLVDEKGETGNAGTTEEEMVRKESESGTVRKETENGTVRKETENGTVRKETESGTVRKLPSGRKDLWGWSTPGIIVMVVTTFLMVLFYFAAGIGFGKMWKLN